MKTNVLPTAFVSVSLAAANAALTRDNIFTPNKGTLAELTATFHDPMFGASSTHQRVDLVVMGEQALKVERGCGERLADAAPCTVLILVPPVHRGSQQPVGQSSRSHKQKQG